MDGNQESNSIDSPMEVLGLPDDADEQQIRARYLELIRKFTPEREPEKFQQIQSAYDAAKDPLLLAHRLLQQTESDEEPAWRDAIDAHANRPPTMSVDFVLSLGNRSATATDDSETTAESESTDE